MTLLPKVDEYACCGHGDCAAIAPNVFRVDEIAVVTGSGPDERHPRGRPRLPGDGDRGRRRRHRRAGRSLRQ